MSRFAVMRRFSGAPWFTRLFVFLRLASCPFEEIIAQLPSKGTLLDIGTGFGLLPLLLATGRPRAVAVGIDPDTKRIRMALVAARGLKNTSFITGSVPHKNLPRRVAAATLIDVLYLLPWEEKIKLVREARSLLAPNGVLLVKINDRAPTLAYALTWLQEILTVRIFKKTTTQFRGFYFENAAEMKKLLEANGFRVDKVFKLTTPFPFFHPHWLLVARRS